MKLIDDNETNSYPIPSSRFSRLINLGSMAAGIAGSVLASATTQFVKGQRVSIQDLITSQSNMLRFVNHLSQMRGAAMKVGQLLSLEIGEFISPQASEILSRLRNQGYSMPPAQLNKVLIKNWGPGFQRMFEDFNPYPVASASIGQVHKCRTKKGKLLAIKVQYPGIRDSIDSDIKNLMFLLKSSGLVPPFVDLESLLEAGRRQLHRETDYLREGQFLIDFSRLLNNHQEFEVPQYNQQLSTKNVLAMEYKDGITLDQAKTLTQSQRNRLVYSLMKLLFAEIFDFKVIQTDPNYANFLYDQTLDKIVLLDFGATQTVTSDLCEKFRTLLQATWRDNITDIENALYDLEILHRSFPRNLKEIFIELFLDVTEPIRRKEMYDFERIQIVEKIQGRIDEFIAHQKTIRIPDIDILFIQRKIGGLFFLARHLQAKIDLNKILKKHLYEVNSLNFHA